MGDTPGLSDEQRQNATMLNTAGFAPGVLSFVTLKFWVVFLLTIVLNSSPAIKRFLWALVGISALLIIGCVVILYAQCSPSRAMWTPGIKNFRCWSPWVLVDYSIFAGGELNLIVTLSTAIGMRTNRRSSTVGSC